MKLIGLQAALFLWIKLITCLGSKLKMVKIKLNDLLFAEQNVESLLCIKL
jgi:hypothetical protein